MRNTEGEMVLVYVLLIDIFLSETLKHNTKLFYLEKIFICFTHEYI